MAISASAKTCASSAAPTICRDSASANAWSGRLTQFELAPMADVTSLDLPLGHKQRLAMACALMHEPEILFLDEPTSGVDPLARREFWSRINALAEQRVTVMVTTHFMEEAEYCDRLAIMADGEILAIGTPEEIKQRERTDRATGADDGRRLYRADRKQGSNRMSAQREQPTRGGGRMRLRGLIRKEFLQILRDPSSIAIAFLLPVVLLLIFGYGVSLDAEHVPIALVVEQPSARYRQLHRRFQGSRAISRRCSCATCTRPKRRSWRGGWMPSFICDRISRDNCASPAARRCR